MDLTQSHYSNRHWVPISEAAPSCDMCTQDLGVTRVGSIYSISQGHKPERTHARSIPNWRFQVMTYNVLSDQYAEKYAQWLYKDVPSETLTWKYRMPLLVQEILHWAPDVICLQFFLYLLMTYSFCIQEVSHFEDFEDGLKTAGYEGVYVGRPGGRRRDGCATFWKASRLSFLETHSINFKEQDLDENVALLVHLKPVIAAEAHKEPGSSPECRLIVSNTHICFNPSRGEVKLGQVRTLMTEVNRHLSMHAGAVAVVCGDFNMVPKCPIYEYIIQGQVDLRGKSKKTLSGQVKGHGHHTYFQHKEMVSGLQNNSCTVGGGVQLWSHLPCFSTAKSGAQTINSECPAASNPNQFPSHSASAASSSLDSGVEKEDVPTEPSPGIAVTVSVPIEAPTTILLTRNLSIKTGGHHDSAATHHDSAASQSASLDRSDSKSWCFRYLKHALGPEAAAEVHRRLEYPKPEDFNTRTASQVGAPVLTMCEDDCGSAGTRTVGTHSNSRQSSVRHPRPSMSAVIEEGEEPGCQAHGVDLNSDDVSLLNVARGVAEEIAISVGPGQRQEPNMHLQPGQDSICCGDIHSNYHIQQQLQQQNSLAGEPTPYRQRHSSNGCAGIDTDPILAVNPLHLNSSYNDVLGEEPLFSSLHSEFIGTCDYIWYSPHCSGEPLMESEQKTSCTSFLSHETQAVSTILSAMTHLRPVAVLSPPLIELLPYGLPAMSWGSDHVCLVSEFELFHGQEHHEER
ncbi:hypothetical protein CEUSTIGMA_g9691.t1 [Chlamydomonas eustigma]|uniref:Endonuclease/exonuclease/phosphatase domain-containing protein n=1 Tax=Chlamydomonas eustigma TaxID=1157962 RepID=A0A250XGT4_9CHLO|nr:hypothetical protein CEUSTIGMA_g9691.t1 [Chlamydomonas eustigma]|eukprot:GAX82263.1 hypothetical protein CEUSTIGMA_g9691.t1 [Chlamydomonas eustigma]